MAEAVVTCLLNKLADLLDEDAHLLLGIHHQVKLLHDELNRIQHSLEDPFSSWRFHDDKRSAVKEITAIADDVEDLIDNHITEDCRYVPLSSHTTGSRIERVIGELEERLSRIQHCPEDPLSKWRIEKLDKGLGVIYDSISVLPKYSTAGQSIQADDLMPDPGYVDESIIGFEDERENIVDRLLSPIARRCVIPIVGTGGLGKTALTESIYHSNKVKAHFPVRAWISVSQEYSTVEILKKLSKKVLGTRFIIKAETEDKREDDDVFLREKREEDDVFLREKREEDDVERLTSSVHDALREAVRYLIVVDDVWSTEVLEQILVALPDVKNKSRVILTTRLIDVARSADPSITPLRLRFLDHEESEKLFLNQVYLGKKDTKSPEPRLKIHELQYCTDICGGLPLALILLGGLCSLTSSDGISDLILFMREFYRQRVYEDKQCMAIFVVSYQYLPPLLKPCFLYLSSFPEYANISAAELISLWIAEGFVPKRPNVTKDNMARGFLSELIRRRMLKVTDRRYDGTVERVQIHNVLRDFCKAEAASVGFLNVVSSLVDNTSSNSSNSIRRLVFHNCTRQSSHGDEWISRASRARTLLGFNLSGADDHIAITSIIHEAKLLRVINIEGSMYYTGPALLPRETTNRVPLRHLRLKNRSTFPLELFFPSSVQGLPNLQILDVSPIIGRVLSEGVLDDIGHLKKLETLRTIRAGRWIEKGLAELINLRKLAIHDIDVSIGDCLLTSLQNLQQLDSLKLHSDQEIPMEVLTIFQAQHPLRSLILAGPLSTSKDFPSSKEFPPNLRKLILEDCQLEEDPMAKLEKLPKLEFLFLADQAYAGRRLVCSEGGFPQLQLLVLENLYFLEECQVEKGAMPRLSRFVIRHCPSLKTIPKRLQKAIWRRDVKEGWGYIPPLTKKD